MRVLSKDQFTGLYDATTWKELTVEEQTAYLASGGKKNKWIGKEIYTHDIVYCTNRPLTRASNYEVIWDTSDAGFSMISAKRDGDEFGVYTRNIASIRKEEMRIVGNIFQNPELINAPVKKVSKKATAREMPDSKV